MLSDIRKEEKEWDKKPVKRRAPKVFKYEGKDGLEEELTISEDQKDAWLKRAMNQPLTDREERLLLKLNNNILILETDQKLKEIRRGTWAKDEIIKIQENEIKIQEDENSNLKIEVEALRQGKPYDRKGHREAHTKP